MGLKLTPRLALVFILFALAISAGVGILAYYSGRLSLEAAAKTELQSTALEKEAALEAWIIEREASISALARSPYILEKVEEYLDVAPDSKMAYASLIRELTVHTGPGQAFLTLLVLSSDEGRVIASVDPGEEGGLRTNLAYFIEGKRGLYTTPIYYSPDLLIPAMTTAAPLYSAEGKLLGVLAGRLNLEELDAIVQRRSGLRETDDAFLVNSENQFVTQPRFIPDPAVLKVGVYTEPVQRCLAGDSNTISAVDYRGVPVIAVYRWLSTRQMCLIVKISQAETVAPVERFGTKVIGIALGTLVAASVAALLLSNALLRPIQEMQVAAQRYGRGDLDVRLPETRRDELGVLAHEFNQMAGSLAEKEQELRSYAQNLEQKVLERTQTLRTTIRQLQRAEQIGQIGSWEWDVPGDHMIVSDGLTQLVGTSRESLGSTLDAYFERIHPDDLERMQQTLANSLQKAGPFEAETRFIRADGRVRTFHARGESAFDADGKPARLIGVVVDITERKEAEEALQRLTDDLRRSNAELEQFAYVASHDLQEPLRMISSYMQLLSERYTGKLDSDADEFIHYAVDGATRMQNLINDLLAYSRVGTRGKEHLPVSMEDVLRDAVTNLEFAIEESGARVTHEALPHICGDPLQLVMVLQNLIGNAIKFRGAEAPCIHVDARRQDGEWLFSVSDNGIGFDQKFAERVFVIFQRLHARAAYPGTGIGLAICKRIILRHGGRIWVESQRGQGSVFYFTLPALEAA